MKRGGDDSVMNILRMRKIFPCKCFFLSVMCCCGSYYQEIERRKHNIVLIKASCLESSEMTLNAAFICCSYTPTSER